MSYNPKYREWVNKYLQDPGDSTESYELYEVYREIPILRAKVKDNPPQYRFMAPILNNRARNIDRIHKRIDNKLEKPPRSRDRDKKPRKVADRKDTKNVDYFLKWQNCQVELMDVKKREASMLSRIEELQEKVNELSTTQQQLKKEAADLRSQLRAARLDLNNKK